jgi:hypothetical protein
VWEEGREPGNRVVALASALTLTAVVIDLPLQGHVGVLVDLVFVGACVAAALMVRPPDFFAVGVLPPLLMVGLFVLLAIVHRSAIGDPGDGLVQAIATGLARHCVALFVGYALTLGALAMRRRVLGLRTI